MLDDVRVVISCFLSLETIESGESIREVVKAASLVAFIATSVAISSLGQKPYVLPL